jgi:hemolysin III
MDQQLFDKDGQSMGDHPSPPTERPRLCNGQPLHERIHWYIPPRRKYSRRELLADRTINFVGAAFAWLATLAIGYASWKSNDAVLAQVCFWIHGAGLIIMLNCSAFYHYKAWDWQHAQQLLSLDHVGISAMIVGCYAPVMHYLGCYRVFAFVAILGGAVLPLEVARLCQISRSQEKSESSEPAESWPCFDKLHIVRYLVMGWAVVIVFPTLLSNFPVVAIMSCIVGGVIYTAGVYFFTWLDLEYHMAIWHGMVLVASVIFYLTNLLVLVGLEGTHKISQ